MRPVVPRTFTHLSGWCWMYQHSDIAPRTQADRFSIGLYQIGQGMSWKCGGPVSWQSYASAAIHWICCLAAHNESMDGLMPCTLQEMSTDFYGWKSLMYDVCRAQQQVIYACTCSGSTTRASRFDLDRLRHLLAFLVEQAFSLVPPDKREDACIGEMCILTNDLLVKP